VELLELSWLGVKVTKSEKTRPTSGFTIFSLLTRLTWLTRSFVHSDPIAPEDVTLYAAYGASTLTRTASRLCFADYKRAMQTGEMLGYVGKSFEEVFGSDSVTDQAEVKGVLGQVGGIVEGLKKSIL